MYKVSAAINEVMIDLVPLDADLTVDEASILDAIEDHHRLIFLCSPNNPTGGIIPANVITAILEKSNGLVIIDEAYIDFSSGDSWLSRIATESRLVVLQTLSKSLGAAGLRIGFGFMNPYLVKILNKIKPPYNVPSPSQEIAIKRITDIDRVGKYIREIVQQRERLINCLQHLDITTTIYPSEANFLLVRFVDHQQVYDSLKAQKIIVRDRSAQRGCAGCLRISIGTKREMDQLISVLENI